jgi:lactate permease
MLTVLAALPLLVSVAMVLVLGQPAARAGWAGLAAALAAALALPPFRLAPGDLAAPLARAALLTLTVSYVLLGGLLLYRVLEAGRALTALADAVAGALPDPGRRVLVLVYGVSVFFESLTGFGVGIVVCAPLFAGLALGPVRTGVLALLGQCAVPWGALAVGTVLGAQLTGVPAERIAWLGALLGAPFVLLCGLAALWLAGGWALLRRRGLEAVGLGLLVLGTLAYGSLWAGVELAGVVAGAAVTLVGWLAWRPWGLRRSGAAAAPVPLAATLPLLVTVGALLATRLLPGVGRITQTIVTTELSSHSFRLAWVHHPGFWLLAGAAVGVVSLRLSGAAIRSALRLGLRQWVVATGAVAGFLGLSQVMFQAGMTRALAESLAALGGSYVVLLPFVAGLGGFLTASNAGANAMLAQLQTGLGARLGLPSDWVAAAQNAAASNATLASPGRVILAAAVTGQAGQEGPLMRPALLVALAGSAGTGILLWLALA